ncbi:CLUMA_CG005560, isoform A, partial [Clunio marinus]
VLPNFLRVRDITYSSTKRGYLMLIYKSHAFLRENLTTIAGFSTTLWHCREKKRKKCRVRINHNMDLNTFKINGHDHNHQEPT